MFLLIAIAACSGRVSGFICRIIFLTSNIAWVPNFAADRFLFVPCCAHRTQQPLLSFLSHPRSQAAQCTVCTIWTYSGVSEVLVCLSLLFSEVGGSSRVPAWSFPVQSRTCIIWSSEKLAVHLFAHVQNGPVLQQAATSQGVGCYRLCPPECVWFTSPHPGHG